MQPNQPGTVRGALDDAAVKLSSLGQALQELSPPRTDGKDTEWSVAADNPIFSETSTPRGQGPTSSAMQTPPRGVRSPVSTKSTPRSARSMPGSAQKVEAEVFPRSFPVKQPTDDGTAGTPALQGGLAGWMRRHKALMGATGASANGPAFSVPNTQPVNPPVDAKPAKKSEKGGVLGWVLMLLLFVGVLAGAAAVVFPERAGVLRNMMVPVKAGSVGWRQYVPGWLPAAEKETEQSFKWLRDLGAVKAPAPKVQKPGKNEPAPTPVKPAPVKPAEPAVKVTPTAASIPPTKPVKAEQKVEQRATSKPAAVPKPSAKPAPKAKPTPKATTQPKIVASSPAVPDFVLEMLKGLQRYLDGMSGTAATIVAGAAGVSVAAGIVSAALRRSAGPLSELPLAPTTTPIVGGRSRSRPRSSSGRKALPSKSPSRARSASRGRRTPKTAPAAMQKTNGKTLKTPRRLAPVLDSASDAPRGRTRR